MSKRSIHLVGSYPAEDVRQAMTLMAHQAGEHLLTLADGEVGARRNWIRHIFQALRNHPDIELRKDGDSSGYEERPILKVKPGRRLTADALELGHVEDAARSYAVFKEVRAERALDHLSFQVGIPSDLNLALFMFGPAGILRLRVPFRRALIREIGDIAAWGGRDVLFQLEMPAELGMMASAPKGTQRLVAPLMAAGVVKLAAAAPAGTRFGIHLCVGDFHHKALTRLGDTGPIVALTQALVRAWPAGRDLEYVHLPLAAGERPPVLDPGFYRPLGGLRALPESLRLIAGLVHEEQDLAEQVLVLQTVEQCLGRTVGVSPACGLGRRTPEAAERAVERALALARS